MKPLAALLFLAAVQCGYGHETSDIKLLSLERLGGQNTPIVNHPFQVSISVDDEFVCSGSLIHSDWVLTVASCVKGYDPYYMKVRVGSAKTDSDGAVMSVEKIVSHQDFTAHSMDNDIALLHLTESVKQGPKVRIIRIATDHVTTEEQVTVTGWGIDQADNKEADLMKVEMSIKDLESCKHELTNEVITNRMICASNAGKDGPCWGDFGDPMVNKWHALVGVYSFTKECPKYPSIFTDVLSFKPWIKTQLQQAGHQLEE